MSVPVLKNLSKCFSMTLVSHEAAPFDVLSEHYSYRSQQPGGGIRGVLQHILLCVYIEPQNGQKKRHADETDFQLKERIQY